MFTIAYEFRFYVGLPDEKSFDRLVDIVTSMLTGATITKAIGIWLSEKEYSAIITVIASCQDMGKETAIIIARILRDEFGQNCVMVTEHQIERALI